jgi:L-alanine-DL-glutamate epimerase-like enolase superfamily enzyme
MKVTGIDTFVVDGGLRPWLFCAVRTDDGITGYGEFGTGIFPRGLPGLVADLSRLVVGKDPSPVEKLYLDMYRHARRAPYGATAMAIAGIELALWDVKGKALGVPVHALAGGPFRERQRVYWSHVALHRATHHELLGAPPLRTMDDIAACAREVVARGFTACKTSIVFPGTPSRAITQGTAGPEHDQVASTELIAHVVNQIATMREALGPDIDLCLDVNFNFKPSEAIRLARALEPFGLHWLEIDDQDPQALASLRSATRIPICSGEQLLTPRQYRPFFDAGAMDVVKVDIQWQGFSQARKVAELAELHELNIAPHNFNGHLGTFESLNLAAAVPNVHIMETDVEAAPWRDELFTRIPEVASGYMPIPSWPGWGTDLDEAAARKYAWKG